MKPPEICLVEDDPIMGESLVDRLTLEGFATDWHTNAASALHALSKRTFAAVISDIRLPDLSGPELFEQARKAPGDIPPFLFITAFASVDSAVALMKLGAADYITKPFDINQLVAKVRALSDDRDDVATPSELEREAAIGDSQAAFLREGHGGETGRQVRSPVKIGIYVKRVEGGIEGAKARLEAQALFGLLHEREEIRCVALMAPRRATFERLGEFGQDKFTIVGDFGDDDAGTVTPIELADGSFGCSDGFSGGSWWW